VLGLFAVCTAGSLVLFKATVALLPGAPCFVAAAHLAPAGLLLRWAALSDLVDAAPPSPARALLSAPHALLHALALLCVLAVLAGGSVELLLSFTAALAPPLAHALDVFLAKRGLVSGSLLGPGAESEAGPEHRGFARRRAAASAGVGACTLAALSERGDSASAYLALLLWFGTAALERCWDAALTLAGEAGAVEAPSQGALPGDLSTALTAAAGAALGRAGPAAQPPSAYERALYGSALPAAPLLLCALLRGELGGLLRAGALNVPSLTTLCLSAAASAGSLIAALLAPDVLPARGLATATAVCNAGTLLIQRGVTEAPRPSVFGLLAAAVAVASGAAYKLAPA